MVLLPKGSKHCVPGSNKIFNLNTSLDLKIRKTGAKTLFLEISHIMVEISYWYVTCLPFGSYSMLSF